MTTKEIKALGFVQDVRQNYLFDHEKLPGAFNVYALKKVSFNDMLEKLLKAEYDNGFSDGQLKLRIDLKNLLNIG